MLHEILLSLSGHPSPLLTADHTSPASTLSPPEKALLSTVAHLSQLHRSLLTQTSKIASTHPSSICQAVASALGSVHLAQFQQKVLEVEEGILKKDAGSVGAYNIVPLTAVVGQFSGWTRRLEWFLRLVDFMQKGKCTGAMVINRLREEIQTGYVDIEAAALSLVRVAETAWLKQVSSWILYGRLPNFGRDDFFVQSEEDEVEEYSSKPELLPAFVSSSTTSSLLFIGRSLNHIRVKGSNTSTPELALLSSHLQQLSSLQFPISSANFSRVISSIRLSLSQKTLQKLLPLSRVVEILTLLREFFLLGRGEFAIALIQEADEKIRSRWQRSDNLAYHKREVLGEIVMKEGEVSAVLARTWVALASLQGPHSESDEDEQLELARDLIHLTITKSSTTPSKSPHSTITPSLATTPFKNLLLSVPTTLALRIHSPLDLFLSPSDIQTYSAINAYLLSIHRAHLRLTDLWKISPLRRQHPAPPGPPHGSSISGRSKVLTLRGRANERSKAMRSVWATSSAAVFFLSETEVYLQGEVVQGSWTTFQSWLGVSSARPTSRNQVDHHHLPAETETKTHDPQTLAEAHTAYLRALSSSLLLTNPPFTQALYTLLQRIDHLVALVHRLHSIWSSLDLEADEGVVDAFSDFGKEERDVKRQLAGVERAVKEGIEGCVVVLRELDQERSGNEGDGLWREGGKETDGNGDGEGEKAFVPGKVGRVDRLLMKLDFGGWFGGGTDVDEEGEGQEGEFEL